MTVMAAVEDEHLGPFLRQATGRLLVLVALYLLLHGCDRAAGNNDDFLVDGTSKFTVEAAPVPPGEPHFFHVITPRPSGQHPVHLLRVEILGVPDGLVFDGVWAVRFSETGPSYVGHTSGHEAAAQLRPDLHKVSEVVLDPACPPSARCTKRESPGLYGTPVQDWYLLAEMHSTRPGRFETKGFRVYAEVDGRKVSQTRHTKRFVVHTTQREEGP